MLHYMAGAMGYAALATLLLSVVLGLAGRRLGRAGILLALSSLTMIFLGLHPFPDPATLDCSAGGARRIFEPFRFPDRFVQLWRRGAHFSTWVSDVLVVSAIMNFVVPACIGAALAGVTRRWSLAVFFAVALSGFIELAQLTGLFGAYSCAYRHFETDDLILNIAGVLAGFALLRRVLNGRMASS